jgi:OFA family oxalate/formate antiporter-like MFS transporter
MNKTGIYIVLAAVAIQLTLGIAYIWSVFQTGIANSIFGGNNADAALSFSLLIAMMTIGSVIGGMLTAKYSIRTVVFSGGIILSLGFFLSSFVTPNFPWLLWVTYGVLGGVGMGFTYTTTIACAQKWFPHKKGLITGIIVSALGFGGVIFAPIVESVIKAFSVPDVAGVGELKAFMVLSAIFLVVCTVSSLFLKNPPEGYMMDKVCSKTPAGTPTKSFTTSEMLKTPQFYLLTATFLLACMGGLMMIGFAKPIAIAKAVPAATIGVLAISMFNSIGRLVWGAVSDKLGRINTLIVLMVIAAVLSLLVNMVNGYWIYVLIALIGFSYGGLLSNFPSLTADLFGPKYMATNYGFVLLGFGAGAVISSQIAGYYKNISAAANDIGLMFPAFVIASCCAAAGIVMMLVLKRMKK